MQQHNLYNEMFFLVFHITIRVNDTCYMKTLADDLSKSHRFFNKQFLNYAAAISLFY